MGLEIFKVMKKNQLLKCVPFLFICWTSNVSSFFSKSIYGRPRTLSVDNLRDVGEPLFLTPLIEAGEINQARDLAKVTNMTSILSYSGFFTVNKTENSNIFFWFFPATFNGDKAPVCVWLQGGPGGSSLFGLFVENGPFSVDADLNIRYRATSWSLTHSMLYIDNPVGTGYSFTDHDRGYARSERDVADGLYSVLIQFFTLFPAYQPRDFYVTGESYAGKYVPAIVNRIHEENQKSPKVKINLKGMAIGDGYSDPENMLHYGDLLYSIGLLGEKQRQHFHLVENKTREFIKNSQFVEAYHIMDELLGGDSTLYSSYFKNCTGFDFYFNFLMPSEPKDMEYFGRFVQQENVRRSIHVGNRTYNDGSKVEKYMQEDMYKTVAPLVSKILDAKENYTVLFYNGQLDIIVAGVLTENFLRKLEWHGKQSWEDGDRKIWRVGDDIGHILPYDQPKWSFDMINRFTNGKPFA